MADGRPRVLFYDAQYLNLHSFRRDGRFRSRGYRRAATTLIEYSKILLLRSRLNTFLLREPIKASFFNRSEMRPVTCASV